ncbi:uncharacterized protein HD556DRAFT_523304 [Suillus plorans]|uniref:Uncharacterized protein n=1 Tax=Suillus plorans TaxID=116603 RepID=A0A9P7ANE1_9AGAM|nr:uncharacterized protein HD556DRAFT_523304 [Suillus plorans]KAG1793150.1 hypothetical protein HD556DRAFT_523304 [Suillus plorans]
MSYIGSNSRDSRVRTPAPHAPHHTSIARRQCPLGGLHRSAYLRVPSAYLCLYSAFSSAYLPEPHTGESCVLHVSCRGAYRVFHCVNLPRYHGSPGHEALLHCIHTSGSCLHSFQNVFHRISSSFPSRTNRTMGKAMMLTGGVGGELGLRALSAYTWHILSTLIFVVPQKHPHMVILGVRACILHRTKQNDLVGARWEISRSIRARTFMHYLSLGLVVFTYKARAHATDSQ